MVITIDNGTVTCALHEWLTHGPMLVQMLPHNLDTVRLTDREPAHLGENQQVFWRFQSKFLGALPDFLPPELFDAMQPGSNQISFSSRAEAQASLSEACLAWARKEAGL